MERYSLQNDRGKSATAENSVKLAGPPIATLPSTVLVRRYEAVDAKMVAEIEKFAVREITPLAQLARYYDIIPECFLVAEVGGKVIGYVVANMHFTSTGVREGHVLAIAVNPADRGNGVGRHLLAHLSNVLKAKAASRIRLEVKASNLGAKEFYLREGFQEIGILRGYYQMRGCREDAIVMFKELT
jgi:ribosomal-protein-alanine N-acetyltransferase